MKKSFLVAVSAAAAITALVVGCNQPDTEKTPTGQEKTAMSQADLVSRGKALVNIGSCNDCHSPKILTPMGPVVDSTKILSGHPANMPVIPFDKAALKPGSWVLMAPD